MLKSNTRFANPFNLGRQPPFGYLGHCFNLVYNDTHYRNAELQARRHADMQKCRTAGMQACRHADMQNCKHADMQTCRPEGPRAPHARTFACCHACTPARSHARTPARPHAHTPALLLTCAPARRRALTLAHPHACTPTRPPTCAPARPPARMFPSCPIGKALKYAYMPAYNYAWFYISFFVVNAFISEQRFAKWLCIPSYLLSQGPVEVQPRPG